MHCKEVLEVKELLKTSSKGLSVEEAAERLRVNGKNVIKDAKKIPGWLKFVNQLKHLMMIVLFVALGLSLFVAIYEGKADKFIDAAFILFIILLNATIGYIQEAKAEKAIDALKKATQPYAKVLRGGVSMKVRTDELVVGDVVLLEAGDIVPADMRLFEVASLMIQEAALTGESVPSEKNIGKLEIQGIALGDQKNMAFSSGVVTYGRGKGIVVATGMQTQLGLIAEHLHKQEQPKTPLTMKLNKTMRIITAIVGVVAAFIFVSRAVMPSDLSTVDNIIYSVMITIAIAVCSIPEALPTCVTITMAMAVQRMSKKKAIIRHLPAVETLGSTEIICSDKTGTLTLNKMTVQSLFLKNPNTPTKKSFFDVDKFDILEIDKLKTTECFRYLKNCMLLCNDTAIKYEHGTLTTIGDPTETALIHGLYKFGLCKEYSEAKYPRIDELPFDSERKMMSVVVKPVDKVSNPIADGKVVMYTKGALDNLIGRCSRIIEQGKIRPITKQDIAEITKGAETFAKDALRVLGYAFKPIDKMPNKIQLDDENDLVFIGFTGMIDPPREEVYESIKTCKSAGIMAVMITGDHRDTAFAIAKQIGIADDESQVITGAQLEEMNDDVLVTNIFQYRVYARVNPEHKVRIVKAFKSLNKVVAMTGDGVNDAPSIKAADIGIGMGITGTDVTKGAADVILTDDNFATIVTAVEEGRRTYSNILKILIYLVGLSLAELVLLTGIIVIANMFLDQPLIFFNPLLILWINVVTDTLPAIAMGSLPAERGVMKQKPNKAGGSLFGGRTGASILVYAMYMVILVSVVYFTAYFALDLDAVVAVTMAYVVLGVVETCHPFNLFSARESIFKENPFKSKAVNWAVLSTFLLVFGSVLIPIAPFQNALDITTMYNHIVPLLFAAGVGFMMVPMAEVYKFFLRRYENKRKDSSTVNKRLVTIKKATN